MRKALAGIAAVLMMVALSVPVFAATDVSNLTNQTVVSADGSCTVSLNIVLHLESGLSELRFPLPASARSVTVNGSSARTSRSGELLEVDLSRVVGGLTGDFSLMLQYSLPGLVKYDENEKLMLTVPLLSGFAYPISEMSFSIALPGEIATKPSFSSGYYQTSIESDLSYTVEGTVISGQITKGLKDRETLVMTLETTEDMFPQDPVKEWRADMDDIAMYVCAGLAALYWLIFLRCLPPRRVHRSTPPEGLSAGALGSALTGVGMDLTMMVMTWARLGYILIHLDDNGRVILHKRMEMGNERSAFEARCFRTLFGKRQMVDGTGDAYARLYRKVAATPPNIQTWFRGSSGNPKILRFFTAGIGLFGGMSLGIALAGEAALAELLIVVMCVLGAVSAWAIQSGMYYLYLHNKQKLWISLGCCAGWLIVGFLAGEPGIAAGVAAAQLLFGAAAAYGGRRNDLGRQTVAQVLGLRRYLLTVNRAELQRLCRNDPEYFFSLAPYALALGVEKAFAKRFGAMRLPGCPYLTTGMDGHLTAPEWAGRMKQTVTALDQKQKRLPYERLLSIWSSADEKRLRAQAQTRSRSRVRQKRQTRKNR